MLNLIECMVYCLMLYCFFILIKDTVTSIIGRVVYRKSKDLEWLARWHLKR